MKRLLPLLLLFIALPLTAKDDWIISTSLEAPYFDSVFAPGFTVKADVLLFDWNLETDPKPDGYGLSLEGGMLFPVRKEFSGVAPFFRLGVIGRKDFTKNMSGDFKSHIFYTLTGRDMPGNGLKPRSRRYFQNTGIDVETNFIYKLPHQTELQTGITLGMMFPLKSKKGKGEMPEFTASFSVGIGYNIH